MTARRMSSTVRLGMAYLLIGLVGLSLVAGPGAAAQEPKSVTVPISKGAWYAQLPPCLSAIDCSVLPPTSPYPEDTLHVAISGGEETARTYVALSFILPLDAVLTGGTLDLQVDTDPSHGSVSPETARMVACLVVDEFEPVRGSADKPPRTKCAVRQGARYDAEAELFTVDLDRFVDEWDAGIAALAQLPSESAGAGRDTWHVVFPAAEKGEEIITATLTYTIVEDTTGGFDFGPDPEPQTDPEPFDPGSSSVSSFAPPSFDTAAGPPIAQAEPVPSALPTASQPIDTQPASAVAASTAGFAGKGFAYPIVWAFPLILLVGYGLIGRALTKEL